MYAEAESGLNFLILAFFVAWCYLVGPLVWRALPDKWAQRGNDLKVVFMIFAFVPGTTLFFVGLITLFSTVTNHAISILLTVLCTACVMLWAFKKNKLLADDRRADVAVKTVSSSQGGVNQLPVRPELEDDKPFENTDDTDTDACILAAEMMLAVNVQMTYETIRKNSQQHPISDHDLFFSEYVIGNSWEGIRAEAQELELEKLKLPIDVKRELLISSYFRAYSKLQIEPVLDQSVVRSKLASVMKNKGDEYHRGSADRSRHETARQQNQAKNAT